MHIHIDAHIYIYILYIYIYVYIHIALSLYLSIYIYTYVFSGLWQLEEPSASDAQRARLSPCMGHGFMGAMRQQHARRPFGPTTSRGIEILY